MRGLFALALVFCAAVEAGAQAPAAASADRVPPGRIEVSTGAGWMGSAGLGSVDANLRAASATPTPFRLFSTDTRLEASPAFHIVAGFAFTPRFGIEGGLTLSHPDVETSISNDVEATTPITITERIDHYRIGASVIVMIRELNIGQRTQPFVAAGADYLRQLHEGQTVVEEGHGFHAGGGLKHWFLVRESGVLSGAGVRVDARLYVMSGGIAFDDGPRLHGAISGSVCLAF